MLSNHKGPAETAKSGKAKYCNCAVGAVVLRSDAVSGFVAGNHRNAVIVGWRASRHLYMYLPPVRTQLRTAVSAVLKQAPKYNLSLTTAPSIEHANCVTVFTGTYLLSLRARHIGMDAFDDDCCVRETNRGNRKRRKN